MASPSRQSSRLAAFATWLAAYGDAWEHVDAGEMARLFVLDATLRPTPFVELLRGRRALAAHWSAVFAGLEGVAFGAQVLGVGDTYAVAHFRVSYRRVGKATPTLRDGILLVALDPRARCTALREWSHERDDVRLD